MKTLKEQIREALEQLDVETRDNSARKREIPGIGDVIPEMKKVLAANPELCLHDFNEPH